MPNHNLRHNSITIQTWVMDLQLIRGILLVTVASKFWRLGRKFSSKLYFWMDSTPKLNWERIKTRWTGKPKTLEWSDMTRHTKLTQRRGCRVPTDMTNWHVHPNIWSLPSVPLLEFEGAFSHHKICTFPPWRRQNKWRGGRRLLTTSNNAGRNVILIICFKAQWETREGLLHSSCTT